MVLSIILLVIGFILLIKGADFFVDGSAGIAKRFHVPSLVIGMTIVAMGTSAPECAVSVAASLKNSNTLAVSNVVGSNIFNLLIVIGLCAVITPVAVKASTLKIEYPFSILVGVLLLVLGGIGMVLGRGDGIILLIIFVLFLLYMVRMAKKSSGDDGEQEEVKSLPMWKCLVFIVGGIAAIVIGSDLVVDAATNIAQTFGVSQTVIGLTIVAFGTSLPELVTSIVAARKKQIDMALGNVIGSNIFNVLFVLGIAASISPISMLRENLIDLVILAIVSLVVLVLAARKKMVTRSIGVLMLAMYAAYMVYIFLRSA